MRVRGARLSTISSRTDLLVASETVTNLRLYRSRNEARKKQFGVQIQKCPMRKLFLSALLLSLLAVQPFAQGRPKPDREFRAAWIATVDNTDFPSRKGLPIEKQKEELLAILDLARKLRLNALIFQVRPMADSVYRSTLEPWSEFLTGEMGKPQDFDPLEFVVAEAHKRGILVH